MNCITCGTYFKNKHYHTEYECEACRDVVGTFNGKSLEEYESIEDLDIQAMLNPSGRTMPVFYD